MDQVKFSEIPNLHGNPRMGVSYGIDSLKSISAEPDLLEANYSQRQRLVAQQDNSKVSYSVQERSDQELRLHEAVEEVYGEGHPLENDSDFDTFLEKLFPATEKSNSVKKEIPVITEDSVEPVQKTDANSFELAKEILGPYITSHEGQVNQNDFENSSRFFLELGSFEIEEEYFKELESQKSNNSKRTMSALEEIQDRIASGHQDAKALKKALKQAGLSTANLKECAQELKTPFSENFANIFFFLKDQAGKEVPDAVVFENHMEPLLEMIRSSSEEIKKPTQPQAKKKMTAGQKKNLAAAKRIYPAKLAKYNAKFERLMSEVYVFLKELG